MVCHNSILVALILDNDACRTRFKLHLRPEHLDSQELNRSDFPPLPPGKTVVEVFADFLHYLFDCARKFIITTIEADGEENLIWDTVKDNIDFILGHPNGWEGLQQEKMRKAAASGGLISDDAEGHARVHFVSEGEASLQFCIGHELITEVRLLAFSTVGQSYLVLGRVGRR